MDASQIPTNATIVTPHDTNPANGCAVLYAGGACTVITATGASVTLPTDFAGVVIPVQIQKVMDTGTDATSVLVFR